MKNYIYTVCPHCEHPNIHVENGRIASHYESITGTVPCIGSNAVPQETHKEPLNRHTAEFKGALARAQKGFQTIPEKETTRPAFTTWKFSGIEFIAVPIDRGNFHIMDALGGNYGAWMSIEKFRKKQADGIIADWQAIGRAHLQIVCNRE